MKRPPVPELTVFVVPKAFVGHAAVIQCNALSALRALGASCQVLVLGGETGVAEVARAFGCLHLPELERNELGTPLMDSVFRLAEQHAQTELMCYVNADIVLLPDLLQATRGVTRRLRHFVIVGQRWDVDITMPLDFEKPAYAAKLRELAHQCGALHPRSGMDYFVYRRGVVRAMPPFAIGRPLWDNWFIYHARATGVPVVDGTAAITAIHQNHDYGHRVNIAGASGRQLEEQRNLDLLGGYQRAFTIDDATWRLTRRGDIVPVLDHARLMQRMRRQEVLQPGLVPLFDIARTGLARYRSAHALLARWTGRRPV